MPTVLSVLDKYYQFRTQDEHAYLCSFLAPFFPTLSPKMLKLISFYLRPIQGPDTLTHKQFTSQSFVITGIPESEEAHNPETSLQFQQISHDKKVTINEGQDGLILDYSHYLNCITLGESSIEEEISFMHASELLCSIPKKRLYNILRNSKILPFSISQAVYFEGQNIEPGESGSGVYFVRKGQFGYFKNSERESKQIETLRFTKGHIFGSLELHNKQGAPTRKFTVKCKSHQAVVYNFQEEIFNAHIKPYCEGSLNSRQSKLMKYIDNKVDKMTETRNSKQPFLSQTLSRGFSQGNVFENTSKSELPLLNRTRLSIPNANVGFSAGKTSLSQQIEEESLRKTQGFSFKDGPLKNYPMASQRCNFTDSEFREIERLNKNRIQCDNIRKLKSNETGASKGQILFSFFKQTWNFDKEKRLANRRYQNF